MLFQMNLTKQILKPVSTLISSSIIHVPKFATLQELDALQFEEEEEGTSYLADINKVPDFVDEPPVEIAEVSL